MGQMELEQKNQQEKIRQQSAQLAAAEEEKRRLEVEKQAEIERLKQKNQRHQLELKRTRGRPETPDAGIIHCAGITPTRSSSRFE